MPGWHTQEVNLSLGRQPHAILTASPVGPHRHPFSLLSSLLSLAHLHPHSLSHTLITTLARVCPVLSQCALETVVPHRPA